jgi:hypothetical protein
MVSFVSAVELCCIDRMNHRELVQAIQARIDDLPSDLTERMEEQPIERLQLLMLTARLIHVLRRLPASE